MARMFSRWVFPLVLIVLPGPLHAEQVVRHKITVLLEPEKYEIQVEDRITLPESFSSRPDERPRFFLHSGFHPQSPTTGVGISLETRAEQKSPDRGADADSSASATVPIDRFTVSLPAGQRVFVLKYGGEIHHLIRQEGEEYARSFSETPGIISSEGVFLSEESFWYPRFNDDLVIFTLEVRVPKGWDVVSQGERSSPLSEGRVLWVSEAPQEGIYLAANRFTEYRCAAGEITTMVFLLTPDSGLAGKYLETAAEYLEMYSKLIGPYPYKKFALVENFWETGYGMPSFTLLGPKVIRFPFILHSSFPHEILHNWWGNGVFVKDSGGNWSEGLTAYLADHLSQEQRGTGAEFRRETLQKYADYVSEKKDFPLTAFRERHSSATEAVGYGRALMFFHMLRQELGDDVFVKALQKFYRDQKFKRASFSDLQETVSTVSGRNLQADFTDWVVRTGAPGLRIERAESKADKEGYLLNVVLEQVQPEPAYALRVPIAVTLEGQDRAFQITETMSAKRLEFKGHFPARPVRVDVDPEFDLFRRLDRSEIPPSLSQMFGAEKVLVLLPASAPEAMRQGYRQLAESWRQSQSGQIEIKLDNEIAKLPSDRAVWLFGWENRFRTEIASALSDDVVVSNSGVQVGRTEIPHDHHSVVLAARHPLNPDLGLAWVAASDPAPLPGLSRKLPHYGKYGYLGFEGEEPTNIAKGEWKVSRSPLSILVSGGNGQVSNVSRARLASREPLASLPPEFSADRLVADVRFLASDAMRGSGFGSPELDKAAEFIAAQFKGTGLKPGGILEGVIFSPGKLEAGSRNRRLP